MLFSVTDLSGNRLRSSQETGKCSLSRFAAVRNSAGALPDATYTVLGFFFFLNVLERSINCSHGLYVNESETFLSRWSSFITFVKQNKLVMLQSHS